MRREAQYLWDILEAVEAIERFVVGKTLESFEGDDLVRSAGLSKLMIVGEAVGRVSDETKAKYPEVPWPQIRGFRNIIVHMYHGINWEIVWNAATLNAPELAKRVEKILAEQFPGEDGERE
jgi:uncharacterized protein with HEPN domain